VSTGRRFRSLGLATKLIAFAGLSALLTTVVITSVLDLQVQSAAPYRAVFTDTTGLQPGDTVRIAGVEVGKVTRVSLLTGRRAAPCRPAGRDNCALVTFNVEGHQGLTTTTRAAVFFENLLGQRFLGLVPGASTGRPLGPGATIPVTLTQPGLDLTAVFNGFKPLFDALSPSEVNQLAASIIAVFQGQSGTVASLVAETASLTNNLADRQQVLDQLLTNLASLLNTVNSQGSQLGRLIDNFDGVVSALAGERSQLGSTIDGLGTLNTTLAGLLQQSQPALNHDIGGLAQATGALAANQNRLDGVVNGLPPVLKALMKTVSTGSYLNVYLCNLTVTVNGALNISLVPGVAAPQYPANVQLPSASVGDQSQHTAVCT
jgi:phospholipid/cholesterol/gamma-HCH transport system substrate-binding protein